MQDCDAKKLSNLLMRGKVRAGKNIFKCELISWFYSSRCEILLSFSFQSTSKFCRRTMTHVSSVSLISSTSTNEIQQLKLLFSYKIWPRHTRSCSWRRWTCRITWQEDLCPFWRRLTWFWLWLSAIGILCRVWWVVRFISMTWKTFLITNESFQVKQAPENPEYLESFCTNYLMTTENCDFGAQSHHDIVTTAYVYNLLVKMLKSETFAPEMIKVLGNLLVKSNQKVRMNFMRAFETGQDMIGCVDISVNYYKIAKMFHDVVSIYFYV